MKEKILCAAIDYNGIIINGHRHSDCYKILRYFLGNVEIIPDRKKQGFLTSENRFVDRKEAWVIALNNNQIVYGLEASKTDDDSSILISENLY